MGYSRTMRNALAALLLLLTCSLPAQDGTWEFRFGPRIIGATIDTRYITSEPTTEGVETSFTGRLSSAYEAVAFSRGADDSLLFLDPTDTEAISGYSRFDLLWEVGLQQGILPRTGRSQDAAVVYSLYRGRYRLPFAESAADLSAAGLPQVEQTLRGSVVSGIAYSTVEKAPITREQQGLFGEFAIEWGPALLHNELFGSANYSRITLKGSGFAPLLVLPPVDGRNRFSLYLAAFGAVDWASGPDVPLSVRQTTGGRGLRGAPGGSVRGFGSGRFDATFKAVGNVELRAALPAIVLPSIIPGLVLYTDFGYYNDADRRSPTDAEHQGFLAASGAGLSTDLFDLATLVFYTSFAWAGETRTREIWTPFAIGFGFHF